MNPVLADILKKRMDKACAIVLGVKERECDKYLPPEARSKLRKVVLDQMNEFYDLCCDVMRSLDRGDTVLNEKYLEKLDDIHDAVVLNGHNRRG
jgi:hypothetical protein